MVNVKALLQAPSGKMSSNLQRQPFWWPNPFLGRGRGPKRREERRGQRRGEDWRRWRLLSWRSKDKEKGELTIMWRWNDRGGEVKYMDEGEQNKEEEWKWKNEWRETMKEKDETQYTAPYVDLCQLLWCVWMCVRIHSVHVTPSSIELDSSSTKRSVPNVSTNWHHCSTGLSRVDGSL